MFDSIAETLKNRLTNSLYGTFFISWVIFHWNFIFSVFALDDSKVLLMSGLLKNDYLWQRYFSVHDWYFWFSWVMPFFLTYIIIWKLPKWVLVDAYTRTEDYETEKKVIKIANQKRIVREEAQLEEQTTKKVTAVAKQKVEEKKIKEADPTVEWDGQYQQFKQSKFASIFSMIITSIYEYNGDIKVEGDLYERIKFQIPQDLLAYAHTNDLVLLDKIKGKIELTAKGKFFVKKYTLN